MFLFSSFKLHSLYLCDIKNGQLKKAAGAPFQCGQLHRLQNPSALPSLTRTQKLAPVKARQ